MPQHSDATHSQMQIAPIHSLTDVFALLRANHLEVSDISDSLPPHFFGIRQSEHLVGVVGIELFGSAGLLRSLAVSPGFRARGLASQLVAFCEVFAGTHGVQTLYLLTTTAAPLFSKLGYVQAERQSAPEAIRSTPQFCGLCPSSSAFMCKPLSDRPLA